MLAVHKRKAQALKPSAQRLLFCSRLSIFRLLFCFALLSLYFFSFYKLYPMSEETTTCPSCQSLYAYPLGNGLYACPECGHEWSATELAAEEAQEAQAKQVLDSNGKVLENGDSVIVIKDLPVKGSSKSIKVGTKVKNIRLTEGEHNIDCKIEGFGALGLKSEFVRKA